MPLRISWQRSSYPMLDSCYQSIGQFIACDEFCAISNEIRNFIAIGINSNLP